MKEGGSISIWFFVGVSFLVNGLLILGSGIYELMHPPAAQLVLFKMHASIWWGALMLAIGILYCVYYMPGKNRS